MNEAPVDRYTAISEVIMRLKPRTIFGICRLILRAVRSALDEIEEAKDADSPGGEKVTALEAAEVAGIALASIVEPLGDLLENNS